MALEIGGGITFGGGITVAVGTIAVTLESSDFSTGFASSGVPSYQLVALAAGTYNITITGLRLTGGFGASVLLSTNQSAEDQGSAGVFDSVSTTSGTPVNYTFSNVTSAEPFYIILDASTGDLAVDGISYIA